MQFFVLTLLIGGFAIAAAVALIRGLSAFLHDGDHLRQTGQSIERVRRDTERNYWMSAAEAIDYGLVSRVVATRRELE